MKKPDEIKKGLGDCLIHLFDLFGPVHICKTCPYRGGEGCQANLHVDALALIRQLETKLAEYENPLVPMALDDANEAGGCSVCSLEGKCLITEFPRECDENFYSEIERIVMDWAAKNQEPRYPSWKEWQERMFPSSDSPIAPCAFASQESLRCESNDIRTCDECRDEPIPAEIAEKLGIKPIGGTEDEKARGIK